MSSAPPSIDFHRLNWADLVGYGEDEAYFLKWKARNFVPSVIIFEGLAGQGKLKFVFKLLANQFCEDKSACGICSSCRQLKSLSFQDLLLFDPEEDSVIKVDTADVLADHLSVNAADFSDNGRKGVRVCLVLDADRFNLSASNRLLKVIEELPDNSQFWMTTSRYEKILPTIRSRSFHWKLKGPTKQELKNYFKTYALPKDAGFGEDLISESLEYCRFNLSESLKFLTHTQVDVFTGVQKDLMECFQYLDFKKDNFLKIADICKQYGLGLKDLLEHLEVFLNKQYKSDSGSLVKAFKSGNGLKLRRLRRALVDQHFYARKLGIAIQAQMALESLSVDV